MFIQIHMLQNHSPSNLNRDDTGAPKDAIFGGKRRARISSQCLKRSVRRSSLFRETFQGDAVLADRTKEFPNLVAKVLRGQGVDEKEITAIVAVLPDIAAGGGDGGGAGEADDDSGAGASTPSTGDEAGDSAAVGPPPMRQLVFLSPEEVTRLAERALAHYRQVGASQYGSPSDKGDAKTKKRAALTRVLAADAPLPRSVDIALFGRMTTSVVSERPFRDVDGATSVQHALSTHQIDPEFDYYTAVDDISGESGAGMIGDVEFNSATYYKYFSVHWDQLVKNLGGDTAIAAKAVQALIDAAARVTPSGKQRSFAAHNLPDLVLVEVQEANQPVSYANAFLRAVTVRGEQSLMDVSVDALKEHMERLIGTYELQAQRGYVTTGNAELPHAEKLRSLPALLKWLPLPADAGGAANSGNGRT